MSARWAGPCNIAPHPAVAADREGHVGKSVFKLAGVLSAVIAVLQCAVPLFGARGYRFVGAGERVVQAIEGGAWWPTGLTLCVGAIFALFSFYAFAAASDRLRPPLLRTGLLIIGLLFMLRGLSVVPQGMAWFRNPEAIPGRFVLFSVVALAMGAVYLIGVIMAWQDLAPRKA